MPLKQLDVKTEKIEVKPNSGLGGGGVIHRNCVFCEKMVRVSADNFRSCVSLSRNRFYCPFCLRNNFQNRSSRNVLVFSYRSIIGYYYCKYYVKKATHKKVWLNQLESFIDLHEKIGLRNPVLSYDPTTYLWFADFNKVGKDSFKAPFNEVLVSAKWILSAFEIEKILSRMAYDGIWEKYEKAFKLFYEKRKRPAERRMLIPTLKKNATGTDELFEETRIFLPSMLELKS